jgi:hypothetical protein
MRSIGMAALGALISPSMATADIITGAGVNGHVKVFDGQTNAELRSFFAYSGSPGGAFVAGLEGTVPVAVPEPGTMLLSLLATGAVAVMAWKRRGAKVDPSAESQPESTPERLDSR